MKKLILLISFLNLFSLIGCSNEPKTVLDQENTGKKKNAFDIGESKYRSFRNSKNNCNLSELEIDKLLNTRLKNLINGKTITNKSQVDINPLYTFTTTVYFDNPFPSPNIYVIVNYNVDSNGKIINAEAKAGSYGYSMGRGYTQLNSFGTVQNGLFIFEITGHLNSSNMIRHFGFIQRENNGGGVGGGVGSDTEGWVQQKPLDNK